MHGPVRLWPFVRGARDARLHGMKGHDSQTVAAKDQQCAMPRFSQETRRGAAGVPAKKPSVGYAA